MDMKSKRKVEVIFCLVLMVLVSATFQVCFSAATQPPSNTKSTTSALFHISGNVYPLGCHFKLSSFLVFIYSSIHFLQFLFIFIHPPFAFVGLIWYYAASINIGNPPRLFELDIDTGSDLTWVQCDAPCTGCTRPRDSLYKPINNVVPCSHQLCLAFDTLENHCPSPDEQCDYEVAYADQGSSLGVLVADYFPLHLMNGSLARPRLVFGCGYDLKNPIQIPPPPPTSGILGLGNGKASIISQLSTLGFTKNVFGHCLSAKGGGFLYLGDYLVPSSGINWTPMLRSSFDKHYSSGPAEILFGGKSTGIKNLDLIFDSGSSYSYFSDKVYQTTLNLVKGSLNGKALKEAPEEKALPVCWKGAKPFKSLRDVNAFFKPLTLSFTKSRKAHMHLPPENYLVVTKGGNVCLGILNGSEVGLGKYIVIGDIFMQDKVLIYDNEKQRIGWKPADCDRLPNTDPDYDEDICQPYAASYGILEDTCTAVYATEKLNKKNGRTRFAETQKGKKWIRSN